MTQATPPNSRHESGLKDLALLKVLWPYVRPFKGTLISALLLLPVASLTMMAQPLLVQRAVDGPIRQGDWNGLVAYSGVFLGVLILHMVCRYYQLELAQMTGANIITHLREKLYGHLQTLSPRFFQKTPTGKLVTRLTSDVENLSEMLSSGGVTILADMVMVLGTLAGCYFLHWQFALILTLLLPILFGIMQFFRVRSRAAYDDIRVKLAEMNTYLQESLTAMDLVQAYHQEKPTLNRFEGLNQSLLKSNIASVAYDCSFTAIIDFIIHLTMMALLALGCWTYQELAAHSAISPWLVPMTGGEMAAFFLFIQQIFNPIEEMSEKFTVIQAGLSSVDKIAVLLQEPAEITAPQTPKTLPAGKSLLTVTLNEITFGYDPAHPVIHNLTATFPAGKTTAIVGPSGGGKSTLMKLLCRFYDVQGGDILWNDIPIQDLDPQSLRRHLVSIQQDDALFSRTVWENITLDVEPPDPEKLASAIAAANAQEMIQRLPHGVDTVLLERGKNLSGGERQLLLFARAFYHDPPVLILDEATAAVDPQTESLIQGALERLLTGRTVIIIAHRLSTIEAADQILVVRQGQVIEQGTHPELMAHDGAYACFYRHQQSDPTTTTTTPCL